MDLWMIIPVTAGWAVLIWGLWQAAIDLTARINARAPNAQDGFTPSMARWGYIGERRGR